MSLLPHTAHTSWMKALPELRKSAEIVRNSGDIEAARKGFALLSEALAGAVETFAGVLRRNVFLLRCPMAFDDRGANWLQDHKDVENPYFGDAMYRCGEVVKPLVQQAEQGKADQP